MIPDFVAALLSQFNDYVVQYGYNNDRVYTLYNETFAAVTQWVSIAFVVGLLLGFMCLMRSIMNITSKRG